MRSLQRSGVRRRARLLVGLIGCGAAAVERIPLLALPSPPTADAERARNHQRMHSTRVATRAANAMGGVRRERGH